MFKYLTNSSAELIEECRDLFIWVNDV